MRLNRNLRQMILTALLAALTAIGAFLRIPVGSSSFTLQFLFTALAGLLLGPGWGALSQALYVLLGLAGLPIFTGGGGVGYVLQPTFGFLLGLIPSAAVIGALSRRGGAARFALACCAGLAALYMVGLPYMHWILAVYLQREWTLRQTLMGGMVIFLPWDALKIAAAALLGARLRRTLTRAGQVSVA